MHPRASISVTSLPHKRRMKGTSASSAASTACRYGEGCGFGLQSYLLHLGKLWYLCRQRKPNLGCVVTWSSRLEYPGCSVIGNRLMCKMHLLLGCIVKSIQLGIIQPMLSTRALPAGRD